MTPLAAIGPTELIIILAIALLLFGGSRLAGLGKGVGRSIREFKEEVKPLGNSEDPETVDAEIVTHEPTPEERQRALEAREAELAAREEELRARETER